MPGLETQFERMGPWGRLLRGPVLGCFCIFLGVLVIVLAASNTSTLGGGGVGVLVIVGVMLLLICGAYPIYLAWASRGGRALSNWGSPFGVRDYPPPQQLPDYYAYV
jgi:hypothetical protein